METPGDHYGLIGASSDETHATHFALSFYGVVVSCCGGLGIRGCIIMV